MKLSQFVDDMNLNIENPKELTKNLLEIISSARFGDARLIYKTQLNFYMVAMSKWKIKKTVYINIKTKYLGINTQNKCNTVESIQHYWK